VHRARWQRRKSRVDDRRVVGRLPRHRMRIAGATMVAVITTVDVAAFTGTPAGAVAGTSAVGPGTNTSTSISGGLIAADRHDLQGHAHLPVTDDRAPAVEIPADHTDVDLSLLAGGEAPGVVAGLEHQVVHVAVVGV